MSLASIMLCAEEKYRNLHLTLAGAGCRMHILHPGEPSTVRPIRPGGKISLLPLMGDVHGITLHGFQYPLQDATLPFGSSRGISNVISAETGTVRLTAGVLLCVCLENE